MNNPKRVLRPFPKCKQCKRERYVNNDGLCNECTPEKKMSCPSAEYARPRYTAGVRE